MTAIHQQGHEAEIQQRRQNPEPQRPVADAAPQRSVQTSRPAGAHRISGAVLKLWYGAGDGSVHSRPVECVPSQTSAVAFLPPRTHWMIKIGNRICDSPKANPPMDDTMFQSVNCTA